jgi:hypothetical protein
MQWSRLAMDSTLEISTHGVDLLEDDLAAATVIPEMDCSGHPTRLRGYMTRPFTGRRQAERTTWAAAQSTILTPPNLGDEGASQQRLSGKVRVGLVSP